MRRFRGFLIVTLVVSVAVVGGAVVGLRASRAKVGKPAEVKPSFLVVDNAVGVSLFAARIAPGPHVVLFDGGLDPEGRPIDALLGALGASRADVTDVFVTHAHFDHVAGISKLPNAHVHLGDADVPLATGQASAEALVPRLLGLVISHPPIVVDSPIGGGVPATFELAPPGMATPKTLKAFPVPGHTPGSYAYLYDGVLVAGDIMVFKQGRLEPTPALVDPHPEQNKASIRALKAALANETLDVVCTSHGGCTPSGLGRTLLDDLASRLGG